MNEEQVKQLLDQHGLWWSDFEKWMVGQTVSMDANGNGIYWDVERYILIKTQGAPDLMD